MKRICVFGAGGVGGYMAAMLARAGRDVSIVARGPHLERIRERGLIVRTSSGEVAVNIPASEAVSDFPVFDVVIVTAKGPGLPTVAEVIAPHLSPSTAVLFATNGIPWFYGDMFAPGGLALETERLDAEGKLHRLIGAKRSLGVVVRSSNVVTEPGVVFNSGGGSYFIGEAVAKDVARLNALVDLLNVEGAEFKGTADIRREVWKKLVRNTAIALLCGLMDTSPGVAFSDAGSGPLACAVMREVADVAAAHGFSDIIDIEEEADIIKKMTAMKPSLVQDLELGRPVEIDGQVLIVLDFAGQARVQTPLLSTLAPLLMSKARAAGCYV